MLISALGEEKLHIALPCLRKYHIKETLVKGGSLLVGKFESQAGTKSRKTSNFCALPFPHLKKMSKRGERRKALLILASLVLSVRGSIIRFRAILLYLPVASGSSDPPARASPPPPVSFALFCPSGHAMESCVLTHHCPWHNHSVCREHPAKRGRG